MNRERPARGRWLRTRLSVLPRLAWLGLLVGLAWLTGALPAGAAERTPVLLLQLAPLDAQGREAFSRLEGELHGAEFEVTRRELDTLPDAEVEPPLALERACRERAAAFALALAARGSLLRLWVYDGMARRLSVQDWQADDPHAPSVLAVRGAELVRARLAAATLRPEEVGTPPVAQAASAPVATRALSVPDAPAPPRSLQRARWELGAELGVASVFEPSAREGSFMPLARLFVAHRGELGGAPLGLALRLGAGGLGSGASVSSAAGHARVVPGYLLGDVLVSAFPSAAFTPFATLALGVSQLRVEGSAEAGFYARNSAELSPIWGAGLGLLARPFEHFGMNVEAQSLFATNPTTVRMDAAAVATFGRPSLLLSTSLVLIP